MSRANLGAELKELAANIGRLAEGISAIRAHVEAGRARLPQVSGRLERVTSETADATHRLIDSLDLLAQSDREAAELLAGLRSACPKSEALDPLFSRLTELHDRAQSEHTRILEILQFQDLTSQQVSAVNQLLGQVSFELQSISTAFDSASPAPTPPRNPQVSDPDASFTVDPNNQAQVDSLIRKFKNG